MEKMEKLGKKKIQNWTKLQIKRKKTQNWKKDKIEKNEENDKLDSLEKPKNNKENWQIYLNIWRLKNWSGTSKNRFLD